MEHPRKRKRNKEEQPKVFEDTLSGITFEVIDADEATLIHSEIFDDCCYQGPPSFTFRRPRPGSIVVDAGANIGLFSLWIATLSDKLRILAFEPLPPIFAVLKRNLTMNLQAAAEAQVVRHKRGEAQLCGGGIYRSTEFVLRPEALGAFASLASEPQLFTYYPSKPGESTRHRAERRATLERVVSAAQRALHSAEEQCTTNMKAHGKGDMENVFLERQQRRDALRCVNEQAEKELDREKLAPTAGEHPLSPQKYRCPVTTLSHTLESIGWISEPIDLLKVDVEGDELEALRGISKRDWCRIQQVIVEVCDGPASCTSKTGESRLAKIAALLAKQGFAVTYQLQDEPGGLDSAQGESHKKAGGQGELSDFMRFLPGDARLFYVYASKKRKSKRAGNERDEHSCISGGCLPHVELQRGNDQSDHETYSAANSQ